jgi:hypothetical protein
MKSLPAWWDKSLLLRQELDGLERHRDWTFEALANGRRLVTDGQDD